MLLLAATTASASTGALVMAAFGLGTLPAMVSTTVAFDRAARLLSTKATLRTVAGALLLRSGRGPRATRCITPSFTAAGTEPRTTRGTGRRRRRTRTRATT